MAKIPKKKKLPKPKVGALLISEPFNPEPTFKRSVVLISQHNAKGSIGFILNKPTDMKIYQALEDFPKFEAPVYWGGKLHLDSIYYIHTLEGLEGCHQIAPGIYWGGNFEQLKVMIESGQVNNNQIRFIAGYNSWSAKELEKEIKKNNWWVADADQQNTFLEPPEEVWGHVLQKMGHIYGILNNFPEDPSIN